MATATLAIFLMTVIAALLVTTVMVFAYRLESLGLNVKFRGRTRPPKGEGKAQQSEAPPKAGGRGRIDRPRDGAAGGDSADTADEGDIPVKKAKSKKRGAEVAKRGWRPWGDHPAVVSVSLLAAVLSIAAFLQPWFSPFGSAKPEPPLTAEEAVYLNLAEDAMRDAVALQNATSAALNEPRKFDSPEFTSLSRGVMDKLQRVMEAEPTERLKEFHANVITVLKNAHETGALMERYSYADDKDAYSRASALTREGTLALKQATAALIRLRNKQHG